MSATAGQNAYTKKCGLGGVFMCWACLILMRAAPLQVFTIVHNAHAAAVIGPHPEEG